MGIILGIILLLLFVANVAMTGSVVSKIAPESSLGDGFKSIVTYFKPKKVAHH